MLISHNIQHIWIKLAFIKLCKSQTRKLFWKIRTNLYQKCRHEIKTFRQRYCIQRNVFAKERKRRFPEVEFSIEDFFLANKK